MSDMYSIIKGKYEKHAKLRKEAREKGCKLTERYQAGLMQMALQILEEFPDMRSDFKERK